MRLLVAIFHYNRPSFLVNCVASVERHLPDVPLLIADDGSSSKSAIETLRLLRDRHEVLRASSATEREARTGGLHANMNAVFDIARRRGFDVVLALQEDMQIVRSLEDDDIGSIQCQMGREAFSGVISTSFTKGEGRAKGIAPRKFVPSCDLMFEKDAAVSGNGMMAYTDTGFFSVRSSPVSLAPLRLGEGANEHRLASMGLRMGFMAAPIAHFLPFQISYRSRGRKLSRRVYDWLSGAGVHPIRDMTPAEVQSMKKAALDGPPIAEDWLDCLTAPECEYWSLAGGRDNLRARGGWRRALTKII